MAHKTHNPQQLSTLKSLLSANRQYHIEYKGFYSNHLPHALISLYHLGASNERLQSYNAYYIKKHHLEPALPTATQSNSSHKEDPTFVINKENYQQYLGERKYFNSYYAFFDSIIEKDLSQQSQQQSLKKALHDYFVPFINGIGHAALHPVIHIGWALSVPLEASRVTLCEGLAYHAFSYLPFDEHTSKYFKESFSSISNANSMNIWSTWENLYTIFEKHLDSIQEGINKIPFETMTCGSFQKKILYILSQFEQQLLECDIKLYIPNFHTVQEAQSFMRNILDDLFVLYACSKNDFFILHAITAGYGVWNLLPHLEVEEAQLALRYFNKVVAAVWLAQHCCGVDHKWLKAMLDANHKEPHKLEFARPSAAIGDICGEMEKELHQAGPVDWNHLKERAIADQDEHTQKLVWVAYACAKDEQLQFHQYDSLYRYAAWMRLTAPTQYGHY